MKDLEMVDVPAEMGVPGVDDIQPKPVIGIEFDSELAAYDFYNFYGGSMGFSIRKNNYAKSKSGEITSRTFVCSKEGHRKHDKRDYQTKNPRAETRTDCDALMAIKLIRLIGKYRVIDFVDIGKYRVIKPKGLKKRIVYDRRRRRIRSSVEKALAVTRQKRHSSQGVQVPPHMLQYLLSQCPQLPNSMPATWNAAAAACFAPSQ